VEVTLLTQIVAITGLVLIGLLGTLQFIAFLRPRAEWTIKNVYGGHPDRTDPTAYFAFNQGSAVADPFFWAPLQIAGSIGMLAGARWGFLLALIASVPFVYSAIVIYVWDRDLGIRKNTFTYWVIVWAIWPLFGVIEGVYCFVRLVE